MVHSVSIVLSSACGPASPTLRSCSTRPCCFRGELAAAPMQCTRTVVRETRSMALAGWPIPPFYFAAHPHRLDGNRYRGHVAHNRQQHTLHTRHDTWRATDRSTHGVRHAASSNGAQHRCSSAPARSARSKRGLAQRSRRSQCKRTSTHSTRHPAAAHSVCARARVRPSRWQLARHVATTCATLHLLQP